MKKTDVAILMGSENDGAIAKEAEKIIKEFGLVSETRVLSAHRTPEKTVKAVSNWEKNGVKVFIAIAGWAAHLAGVIAAHTVKPVIGVPVSSSALNGMDALLSTVQMPPGVPVATTSIDSGKNAGILAVQIIAQSDKKLTEKLISYKKETARKILEKK